MPTEPDPTSDAAQTAEPTRPGDSESSTPAPAPTDPTTAESSNTPADTAPTTGNGSAGRSPSTVATPTPDPVSPMPNPQIPPRIPPRWTRVGFPRGVLSAMTISAVAGAACIPLDSPGIGWFLAAATATTTVLAVDRTARRDRATDQDPPATTAPHHRYRARWWWAALTLALLSVGVIRASGWLFTCCLLAAAATFSLTVVGRRSVSGIWFDILAVPLSTLAMPPWLTRGVRRRTTGATAAQTRIALSLIVTAVLLLIFVPLLAGADAMFAGMLRAVVPHLDAVTAVRWIIVGAITAALTGGSLYLLAGPPVPADARRSTGGMRWRTMEWALPVGALTVLFALFVTVQLTALFGGDDYVQRTAGLTYAEYARSGFWQLSAVSILTLAVIAAVLRWAATDTPAQTLWLRTLPAVLGALTLVIVASALSRMWTYQEAYGFTVLRLLVSACEIWIALLYLMILTALLRLRRAWLPRAAVGAAALTLLLLAATNPERLIADRNIDRWQAGKPLDTDYLSQLSADIAPAADRLPEPLRAQLLDPVRAHTTDHRWQSWTLSRARLR